ncbi:hypothetical protein HZQ11_12255 [Elizabethkingia anophelis]|uniref:hypothetical protein n=1 Tax=Elizabethkingia TaxID=308865 RepID=UPI0007398D4D|nr:MULTISPECIES: hypothetical protein [Elizabethkingia]KUF46398.1 hypothetical protein AS358_14445 [Elizabethkingia anophelis]MCT3645187.1 hypothetical protein [Elizabethkingia anophelis]MCT3649298.1 hypothetical protein [Elizabethkingia anophelis]MCT3653245.1 hypothetical protein [Elizabethkingia anophelis]MCT3656136.1 hypothetical protein [Elizabethkingia anophelis]
MKNVFLILSTIILFSCKKNDFEVKVVNKEPLSIHDSIEIELKNNTNRDYLFYFKDHKFRFTIKSINNLVSEIKTKKGDPIETEVISSPLYIINLDGTLDKDDIEAMEKEKELSQSLIKIIPARSSLFIKTSLMNTMDAESPVLTKGEFYRLAIKINNDSNLIGKEGLEEINKIRNKKNIKLFQGKLESNVVNLKY